MRRIVDCVIRHEKTEAFFRGYDCKFDERWNIKNPKPTWTRQLLNAAFFGGLDAAKNESRALKLDERCAMSLKKAKELDGWPTLKKKKN